MPGIRTGTANLSKKDEKDIVELYRKGARLSEIRAKYKCGHTKLIRVLDVYGIGKEVRKKRQEAPRNNLDISGQRFGRLTAIKDVGSKNHSRLWEFQCDCGKIIITAGRSAISGNTKSCGCQKIDALSSQKFDHAGMRYGHLVAIEFIKSIKKTTYWRFRCDCGNENYEASVNSVKYRAKKRELVSCGCGIFKKPSYEDYTGLRVGMLVALKRIRSAKYGGSIWQWKCDCGNFVERTHSSVKASKGKANCGCSVPSQAKEREGERYGNLVAIKLLRTSKRKEGKSTKTYWLMQCDCGNQIESRINDCVTGRKLSCGCKQGGYDKVEQIIDFSFRNAEQKNYFYVASMKNYSDLAKPGIAEDLEDRVRQSQGEYGEIFNYFELPRLEAWLIEQAVLRFTLLLWKPPSELMQQKWPGYTELRKITCEDVWSMAERFYDDLQEMGRGPFAAEHLVVSPKIKKQLEKMGKG